MSSKGLNSRKYFLSLSLTTVVMVSFLFFINNTIAKLSEANQNTFAYTVKVRDSVGYLDRVLERAELNVSVMGDSISYSYDASKQQNQAYNIKFVDGVGGLVKSVLSNSTGVDGAWFQLNADLPCSSYAYNWFEFKENQFINIKDQFEDSQPMGRKITPEDDPYYFNAVSSQKPVWSDVYTDADTKDSMITISSPVYKDGALVGVAGIDVSMAKLQQSMEDMCAVLGDSELYLLDKRNKVILSELPDGSASPKDSYLFLNLFGKNQAGPIEYSDRFEKKTAILLTLSNNYKMVIAINNKALFGEANHLIDIIYTLYTLLAVLFAVVFISQFKLMKSLKQSPAIESTAEEDLVKK